jgi:hypothetical protein
MSTVDYDTEEGDAYYSMRRTLFLAGRESPYTRPAVDRNEQLLANEVNNHLERLQFGYRRDVEHLPRPACDRCGATDAPMVVVGAVYTRAGKFNRWRCRDGCKEDGGSGKARTS